MLHRSSGGGLDDFSHFLPTGEGHAEDVLGVKFGVGVCSKKFSKKRLVNRQIKSFCCGNAAVDFSAGSNSRLVESCNLPIL